MAGISRPENITTRLEQIAQLAKRAPGMVLTSLAYHIDVNMLREAYRRTRKDGALGVDQQTAAEYAVKLESNLESLNDRFKAGTYKAPPVRRVYIPKAGDPAKQRPIGVPTFEDKILQRAVTMVLESVYEQDFLDSSYGFRKGRSQHQAIEALWKGLTEMQDCWVLEIDIKDFYSTLEHRKLRELLDQRVRDGIIRKMIDKWLRAGVLEEGQISYPDEGTPQGGVVSPMISNVYLHEVIDKWFEYTVKPRLERNAFLIRYADDAVLVFKSERDARRVLEVLPKRFGKYGLTLHPEKTRLVRFHREEGPKGGGKETFDMLGFTHYWGTSRKGRAIVVRKTAKDRFRRTIKAIAEWCETNRHLKVREQFEALVRKLRGHYNYYGITGNYRALARLHYLAERAWQKWLNRRSERRHMPWQRFQKVLEHYPLPVPYIIKRPVANPQTRSRMPEIGPSGSVGEPVG